MPVLRKMTKESEHIQQIKDDVLESETTSSPLESLLGNLTLGSPARILQRKRGCKTRTKASFIKRSLYLNLCQRTSQPNSSKILIPFSGYSSQVVHEDTGSISELYRKLPSFRHQLSFRMKKRSRFATPGVTLSE